MLGASRPSFGSPRALLRQKPASILEAWLLDKTIGNEGRTENAETSSRDLNSPICKNSSGEKLFANQYIFLSLFGNSYVYVNREKKSDQFCPRHGTGNRFLADYGKERSPIRFWHLCCNRPSRILRG